MVTTFEMEQKLASFTITVHAPALRLLMLCVVKELMPFVHVYVGVPELPVTAITPALPVLVPKHKASLLPVVKLRQGCGIRLGSPRLEEWGDPPSHCAFSEKLHPAPATLGLLIT